MRADVYFCITAEPDDQIKVERIIISEKIKIENIQESKIRKTYASARKSIEYDDLGESLIQFCKEVGLPNISGVSEGVLAYLQVLIELDDLRDFKVYLGKELLEFLYSKGFGLDIHHK